MSKKLYEILQRLAEMFPRQDYQTRLEQYVRSRRPQNCADLELLEREYTLQNQRGFL